MLQNDSYGLKPRHVAHVSSHGNVQIVGVPTMLSTSVVSSWCAHRHADEQRANVLIVPYSASVELQIITFTCTTRIIRVPFRVLLRVYVTCS